MTTGAKCVHGSFRQFCQSCKDRPLTEVDKANLRKKRAIARLDTSAVKVWHTYRANCHSRLRKLIQQVHDEGQYRPIQYYRAYDHILREPSGYPGHYTFNEAFKKGFGQFMDVTIGQDPPLRGFDGNSLWLKFLEQTGSWSPDDFNKKLAAKEIRIHGGNGAWSKQILYFGLWKQSDLWPIVKSVVFGNDDRTPAQLADAEVAERIDYLTKVIELPGGFRPSFSFCTKMLHIYDPQRWPVINDRANRDVAARVNLVIPDKEDGSSYLEASKAFRAFASANNLTDLGEVDLIMSDEYGAMKGTEGWSPTHPE